MIEAIIGVLYFIVKCALTLYALGMLFGILLGLLLQLYQAVVVTLATLYRNRKKIVWDAYMMDFK